MVEELWSEVDTEDEAVDERYGPEDHDGGGVLIAVYYNKRLLFGGVGFKS